VSRSSFLPRLLLAALVCGFLALGGVEAWRDAPTYDEPVYVAAGLAALEHGDLTVNDEHPPLAKVIAALPVLLADPAPANLTPRGGTPTPSAEHAWAAGFVRAQLAAGRLRVVTFASRLVPLAETALVGILLFVIAAELWEASAGAGLLAALLWLAAPMVIGFGHLDGVDVSFALAVLLFSWALLHWLEGPSRRRLCALTAAAGAVALTDADGIALVLLAGLVVGLSGGRPRTRLARTLLVIVGAGAITWLPYVALDPGSVGLRLLPADYVQGLRFLVRYDESPAPGFVMGMTWTGGRWWFWPLSLLVKLAPSTLVLSVFAPLGWRQLRPARRRALALAAGAPALILLSFCLSMPRDTSVRYLLPVLALGALAAGGLAAGDRAARWRSRLARTAMVGAVLLTVATAFASAPDSLAWTDPLFGAGDQVADNADLDWGQDWYALQRWVTAHPGARVAYFGPAGLVEALRAEGARPLLGVDPRAVSGWVAVSATELDTSPSLAWLQAQAPVRVIDRTLLIYREPPARG
jgi:4-amino-4-deoxy-L-arabinose transferase-like glycosyltransferase